MCFLFNFFIILLIYILNVAPSSRPPPQLLPHLPSPFLRGLPTPTPPTNHIPIPWGIKSTGLGTSLPIEARQGRCIFLKREKIRKLGVGMHDCSPGNSGRLVEER